MLLLAIRYNLWLTIGKACRNWWIRIQELWCQFNLVEYHFKYLILRVAMFLFWFASNAVTHFSTALSWTLFCTRVFEIIGTSYIYVEHVSHWKAVFRRSYGLLFLKWWPSILCISKLHLYKYGWLTVSRFTQRIGGATWNLITLWRESKTQLLGQPCTVMCFCRCFILWRNVVDTITIS